MSLIKAYEALHLWTQKKKYGIPLLKYTVFLQNCPLGYDPKSEEFFVFGDRNR